MKTLKNVKSVIEKNVCSWCIENYIPFSSMEKEDMHIVKYENLYNNFKKEIIKIIINMDIKKVNLNRIQNFISPKAKSSSPLLEGVNPLKVWSKKFSKKQIKKILDIVKKFSLDSIYDEHFLPKNNLNKGNLIIFQ